MSYDLAIALRVSPKLNKSHLAFDQKRSLVESSFDSLLFSVDGLRCQLIVILDDCPAFEDIFRTRVEEKELEVIKTDGIGNAGTFALQLRLLKNQAASEFVYFAEDDYFYVGRFADALDFLASRESSFATPYDHPDFYGGLWHRYAMNYINFRGYRWKSVASSTNTILAHKSIVKKVERILALQGSIGDYAYWNILTRKNPVWKLIHPRYRFQYRTLPVVAFYWLQGTAYELWAPEPTICSHMVKGGLSPGIDWSKYLPKELLAVSDQGNEGG